MKYDTVEICLWNLCNADCPMCLYSCNPSSQGKLEPDIVRDIIKQAGTDERITKVVLTGGEPFLDKDFILEILHLGMVNGLYMICLTNGFWCENFQETYAFLRELKRNGLREIITSVDAYHRSFVDGHHIKNLLAALRELDIPSQVTVTLDQYNSANTFGYLKELDRWLCDTRVVFGRALPYRFHRPSACQGTCLLGGRGDKLRCNVGSTLYVHYDGDVYGCCFMPLSNNNDLVLGSVYRDSLSTILNTGGTNLFMNYLLMEQLPALFDYLKHAGHEVDRAYAGGCDFCIGSISDESCWKSIVPLLKQKEAAIARFIYLRERYSVHS